MDAYLIVDPDSRNITIPEIESAFGVYGDNNAERKYFKSPRIVGNGIDLTECYLYVNYISSSTKIGQILCDVGDAPNGTATEDEIVFSWPITRNVLDKNISGEVFFAVQAKTKTGDTVFTTRKAKGNCYESIEGTETVAEEYADIILQLISRMDKVEENIGLEVDNYFKENPVVTSEYLTQTLQPVKDDVSSIKEDIDEFYKPISDLDSEDVDLFISDSYGNVLATFKDGEFNTKEFNTVKSIGNNICDTLEDCDLAISDVQGNVAFYVAGGNIITPRCNTKNHHYSTFSIIGDSYSTFKDYTDPLNNLQWYPPSDSATQGSENDVENVENTWWYLFANDYKSLLVQNNSYSGSCISYDSYGTGTVDGKNFSFVKRCENLKKAELIIVEGGTNDAWANVSLGEYKYADWTESDFETFRPSCSYVLDYIKRNNIGSKIIFILNDGLKASITESIKTICEHYSVDVLELSNIEKSNKHPNIEGMKQIKEQLINFLQRR